MKKIRPFYTILLLLLISAVLGGCQAGEKGRKPSQDWSRSTPLGVFVRGDINMAVHPDGSQVHLVWMKEGADDTQLVQYAQMDETAVMQITREINLGERQIRHPKVALTTTDNLHFLWSGRGEGDSGWDLWYGQLNPQSGDIAAPRLIAAPAEAVSGYTLAPDGSGGIFVVWEAARDGALDGVQIGSDGRLLQEKTRLAQGESPSVRVDEIGNLYMTWMTGNGLFFATLADGELETAVGAQVAAISLGTGQTLDNPELGVADEWAYVFWSIFSSSGLQAGTATAEYIAFPVDAPVQQNGRRLLVRPDENQPYEAYSGAYRLTQLALPAPAASMSTDGIREPNAAMNQGDELAVAYAINQDFRLNSYTQIGTAVFKDGEFLGYQMSGKTEAFSQEPVLGSDAVGNLYVAWREGGRGSLVYFALTNPEGRTNLDRIEGNDVANFLMNGGVEIVAGMLFFPLACIWLFPGLAIIGLYHLWRGESNMKDTATIVVMALAIAASQIMKFLFLPTITTYVPFSAWLDIPIRLQTPLIFIVPLLTAGIALLVAVSLHRRTPSGLAFFFWFTATDALLTLAVYGVNFMGVF